MLAFLFVATLLATPVQSQAGSDKSNQAADKDIRECVFRVNGRSVVVKYNATDYKCIRCQRTPILGNTLYRKSEHNSRNAACQRRCNGMLCGEECVRLKNNVPPSCLKAKGFSPGDDRLTGSDGGDTKGSKIPLAIGFTIGGILLAIVVAGIFFGRQQRKENIDGSEQNATTPISLSNSEWHSNGGSGGTRRREENLRVEEASMEDLTFVEAMYELFPDKKELRKDENANEFLHRGEGDSYSITQDSYNDPFSPEYPEFINSNRSSDVILEDGYVPGGNFVGSADPQVQHLLNKNCHSSPNNDGEEEQNFFSGNTPGSMTHETLCMSLTHTANNYDAVEYVIEDQDFMEFNGHSSMSATQLSVANGELNDDKQTLQLSLEYRDIDSDFEEHDSRTNSAMKSDKSDVFFSNSNSPREERERQLSRSDSAGARTDSPFSESGIEASYQSKDSCEVIFKSNNPVNLNSSTSWNENCKGHSRQDEQQIARKKKNDKFIPNGTNRSKSCTWKSPGAPTHSCSRQQSFPIHCPSSEPAYSRPRHSHLTHVFVDVHRNMASSDEDLLGHGATPASQSCRKPSETDSENSFSEIPLSAIQKNRARNSLDRPFSSSTQNEKLGQKKRNKSMYVLRNGGPKQEQNWAPRTVRFSSGGSGEYAIPFGSLVP